MIRRPSHHQVVLGVVLAGVVGLLSVAEAGAETAPIEGAAAFALVNEQRAANGIPEFTTENQSLASWCPNEDHGVGGSGNRVLSEFTWAWSTTESPWETAPFHEALMYDPSFTEAGDIDATGPYDGTGPVVLAACMSVEHERARPPSPQGYIFYAPGGPNDVPPAYTAFEAPHTPAEVLGLPATTGPNIIAYAIAANPVNRIPSQEGATAKVSLAAENGEVVNGIKVVESLSESFIVVPPMLLPETHYHGNVTIELNPHAVSGEPEVVNDALSFTTTAFPNHALIDRVTATPDASGSGGTVSVYVSGNQDPHASVTISASSFTATQALSAMLGQNVSFTVPVDGSGEACLSSPPHDGYALVHQCKDFDLTQGVGITSTTTKTSLSWPTAGLAGVTGLKVAGSRADEMATCVGASTAMCELTLTVTVTESLKDGKLVGVSASKKQRGRRAKTVKRAVTVGSATVTLAGGQSRVVKVVLNGAGKRLLATHHKLTARLTTTEMNDGHETVVSRRIVTFKNVGGRQHRHGSRGRRRG